MGTGLKALESKISRQEHSHPAVYMLVQKTTGAAYVGSTGNLYERVCRHVGRLAVGEHENFQLQEAFDADPVFDLNFERKETREEAYEAEQALLDNTPGLLNIATDARAPGRGRAQPDSVRKVLSDAAKSRYEDPARRAAQSAIATNLWSDPAYREKHKAGINVEKRVANSSELWQDPAYQAKMADYYQSDAAKAHAAKVGARSSKPVTIDGIQYPSTAEAARQLGIHPNTLAGRLKRK